MSMTVSFRRLKTSEASLGAIRAINAELEQKGPPILLTEKSLEKLWTEAIGLNDDRQSWWLLLVRLAEAGLLCAGNYADMCEFRAAGDFLVNPREILIHRNGGGRSILKKRHGRLSEQVGLGGNPCHNSMRAFRTGIGLEITKPPLLPLMTQILRESSRVAPSFINRLEGCQRRIADALAFMAAWRIEDSAELWERLKSSSTTERAFAESRMCRFDAHVFQRIGGELRRSLAQPDYRSSFLAIPQESKKRLMFMAPATLPAPIEAPA